MGEAMATISATFAQLERANIAQRTKDALAQKKKDGVILGRPVVMNSETVSLIASLRNNGLSLQKIADTLNSEEIPTAHAGKAWYPSSVAKTLKRVA